MKLGGNHLHSLHVKTLHYTSANSEQHAATNNNKVACSDEQDTLQQLQQHIQYIQQIHDVITQT